MDILSISSCLLILHVCQIRIVLCNKGTDWYVSYQGFGDLVLTCNGSDVINITGLDLTNHATSCFHQTCALSENDKLLIENCNNKSTCTIPVHSMSDCITQTGFYDVEYACKTKALTCDFDHNRCNIQDTWTVDEARKAGDQYKDHTLVREIGRLMYIINGQSGETKITNRVYSSPMQCLSFYYWGINMGYLTVSREREDGSVDSLPQFPNAQNRWERFLWKLTDIGDYYLRFNATGSSGNSKFLVDDITILNGGCHIYTDHIQYKQTCRRVDDVTELQDCSKYYTKNVISHLDPMKETCHNLFDEEHICNVSSDPIHCDARQLVEEFPSCFNLNTLMINYTCKEKLEVSVGNEAQNTNDAITIGLVAVAVCGVIIVCLILFIVCRYHRRQKEGTTTMQKQSVLWNSNTQAQPNRLESVKSSTLHTDTNQVTSAPEHRHMTLSTAYEAIVEPPNEYTNNPISGQENDNQLGDNYNILDPNSIGKPNVYDDLASPRVTNTHNDTANENEYEEPMQDKNGGDNHVLDNYTTLDPNRRSNPNVYDVLVSPSNTKTNDNIVSDYDEPVPGDYANCIEDECEYEQNN